MRRAAGLALAALALALGAGLALLGRDIERWRDVVATDDLRLGAAPAASDLWRANGVVPFAAARKVLALDDDLAYRDAVALFTLSRPREPVGADARLAALRAAAQMELREVAELDPDPTRRSQAANLVGVLAIAEPRQDASQRVTFLQGGVASFQIAVNLDPGNDDAKFNLELALRRLRAEPGGNEAGRVPGREGATGAGAGTPGSGY